MKKFFSLVLALVMALSLTTVAWGASYDCTGTCSDPATHVAAVGTTHYTDLQEAIDAAEVNGGTVTLLQNVTLSTYPSRNYWLAIEAPITFDGNGKTLTYNASTYNFRVFNIDTTGNVEIKNLTVSTTGERAFNVIDQAVNLTLTNVNATAANYALMVATSAADATVTITSDNDDNYMTGLNVINVAAPGAEVSVEGYTLTSLDPNTSDDEGYAALILTETATGATITASDMDFVVSGDSSEAYNGANGGEITIAGSTGVVPVAAAAIQYDNGYAYLFDTIQDAIDHAVNVDNATESNPVKIIVMDAAINSGESFTLVAGVKLDLPAGAGAEMVTLPNGSVAVVTPATFSGTTAITSSFKEDGTYYVLYNGIWDEVTYVPAEDNGDGTGNVAYFDGDLADYIICKKNDDDAMKLTSGIAVGDKLLNYVKPAVVEYTLKGVAVAVSNNLDCDTDKYAKGYKHVDEDGIVSYYVDSTTSGVYMLVGKELKEVAPQTIVKATHFLFQNKTAPVSTGVYEYKCIVCGNVYKGTANILYAGQRYTKYDGSLVAAAQAAYDAAGKPNYTTSGVEIVETTLYLLNTATSGSSLPVGGTTTTDKVQSAETFDAGIAMYVGMSVMAAAGSAVVIGKKKD